MANHLGQHAVVIGGSIAGLMTARVLAHYFGTVTVIERDQSNHIQPCINRFLRVVICMQYCSADNK
jgi:2-polyprenyl-6-methoxyphenol hydroxylase-like FAD-dependent oxidoreductase